MRFIFSVPAHGEASAYTVSLEIHGRDPRTGTAFVNVMGEQRLASIQSGELAFSRPLVIRTQSATKILSRIAMDDLPASLRAALHVVLRGGSELDLELCEVCGNLTPVDTVSVKSLTVCLGCAGRLKERPSAEEDIPF